MVGKRGGERREGSEYGERLKEEQQQTIPSRSDPLVCSVFCFVFILQSENGNVTVLWPMSSAHTERTTVRVSGVAYRQIIKQTL